MNVKAVFITPKITEKSLGKTGMSVYAFQVAWAATKPQIKQTIEELFGVTVRDVKTNVRKGKKRRVGKRQSIKKLSDTKIAYIKITKGKIDLFPQA